MSSSKHDRVHQERQERTKGKSMVRTHKAVNTHGPTRTGPQGPTRMRAHQDSQELLSAHCPGHGRKVAPHRSHGTSHTHRPAGLGVVIARLPRPCMNGSAREQRHSHLPYAGASYGVLSTHAQADTSNTQSQAGPEPTEKQGLKVRTPLQLGTHCEPVDRRMIIGEACIPAWSSPDASHKRHYSSMVCMALNTLPARGLPQDSPYHAAHNQSGMNQRGDHAHRSLSNVQPAATACTHRRASTPKPCQYR